MKVKKSFGRVFATVLTVVLTISMLLLASVYIGGTRFTEESSAIKLEIAQEGIVPVGGVAGTNAAVYEKNLLNVSFASIILGGRGGGAHGSSDAAKALLEFALSPLHACLSGDAELAKVAEGDFAAATYGDYVFIDIGNCLPYQMLYALSGEYVSAARSEDAVSADRFILAFSDTTTVKLYLSDGENCYTSSLTAEVSYPEAAALAGDSRLERFTLNESGVPTSDTTVMLPSVSFSSGAMPKLTEQSDIQMILGYDQETSQGAYSIVEPHGTLRITPYRIAFNASSDGGIPVSDFLSAAKDELDIGLYDILLGSVSLCESLTKAAPSMLVGADYYLKGFYRDSDIYTVIFGAAANSVAIDGDGYPHFAKFTIQNGRFRSIELRRLTAEENSVSSPIFPSSWQYAHASKSADIDSLRLFYRISLLPVEEISAAWYYTGEKLSGGGDS